MLLAIFLTLRIAYSASSRRPEGSPGTDGSFCHCFQDFGDYHAGMTLALAYADGADWQPIEILTAILLITGLPIAYILLHHYFRNPPDRTPLDARIVARAWPIPLAALTLALYFLLNVLASATKPFFYAYQMPVVRLVAAIAVYGTVMLFAAWITRRRRSTWTESFGLGRRQLRCLLYAPLLYLALIPFLMVATHLFHLLLEALSGSETQMQDAAQLIAEERSWLQVCYMLVATLAAPFYEEVIFRGIFFPAFAKHAGRTGGIVLASAFFALMHMHLPSFLPLFMLSAVLCFAYWRTGSLWTCIGLHAIYNAVSVFSLHLSG